MIKPRALVAGILLAGCIGSLAPPALSDNCIQDVFYNGDAPGRNVFPNWKLVFGGNFTFWMSMTGLGPEYITGVTIVNYGDAVPGVDITNVYWRIIGGNGKNDTGPMLMTYVGVWTFDTGSYPAWTWTGPTAASYAFTTDLCNYQPACGQYSIATIYYDVAPCPTPQTTVNLGFPTNETIDPIYPGSVYDDQGCVSPWYSTDVNRGADIDTIVWAYKDVIDATSPGDTITYTITYSRAGSTLNGITIMDSLPPYTHYLMGSGSPPPDPGWDPDPGPPTRLRWSFPGPIDTSGGTTGLITYSLSVDWGNGEAFEPGSGDVAAPEGYRLQNWVHASYDSDCARKSVVTEPTDTVVRRFLFWKVGDNDLLFTQSMGQPPDEMIYSIFMKNLATKKTWWNVVVWDTVPAELDAWDIDCGFEDPCVGWTMTPTGCAAASPGRIVTGAKTTILTWWLDMPPFYTLTVRWKAKVRPSVTSGATAINRASIRGRGRTSVVEGTGDTGVPRNFTHMAMIKLNTMYVSYVGIAATDNDKGACPGYFLDFFPLNKKCQFELRAIQYQGVGFASVGGVSDSIGCWIGDCIGGFPGNATCLLGTGAIPGNVTTGHSGCKAERIPATYDPTAWVEACPTFPYNFLFKVTSNSPVLWQMLTRMNNCNQDRITYAPSTTLSYVGYTFYTWHSNMADGADQIYINMSPTVPTTIHVFRYDYASFDWTYDRSYDLGAEACATRIGSTALDFAPFRILSSDSPTAVHIGEYAINTVGCCCCQGADNHGAFCPMVETGYVVGSGTFYGIADPQGCVSIRGIVCVGAFNNPATYEIWTYSPAFQPGGNPKIPPLLRGTSGSWEYKLTDNVTGGIFAGATTPVIYGGAPFKRGGSNLFKIKVTSGGPIQVLHGTNMWAWWSGGAVLHSASGIPTGNDFWYHMGSGSGSTKSVTDPMTLDVQLFTPETGIGIRAVTGDGYSAAYTTTGVDQCVAFYSLTDLFKDQKRIARFSVLNPGAAAIALYQMAKVTEKGFTAPFLATGTFYDIIAPQVVYSGQNFWITIVVRSELGGVVTTYAGTTSFTSTDPKAQIQMLGMDSYNYTWVPATDGGMKIFVNVSLSKIGMASIVASDTSDGSITGLASISVVGVDIKFWKEPKLSVAASGDTVRFKVCWSNYSSASAFTMVMTDAVPLGTTFIPEAAVTSLSCGNTDGSALGVAYSTLASPTVPVTTSFSSGNPTAATRWLRWTVPIAGVETSGCACFRVQVN